MGGEGTHTKSGARERGFPARTEGRNRSEARTREGDGREKTNQPRDSGTKTAPKGQTAVPTEERKRARRRSRPTGRAAHPTDPKSGSGGGSARRQPRRGERLAPRQRTSLRERAGDGQTKPKRPKPTGGQTATSTKDASKKRKQRGRRAEPPGTRDNCARTAKRIGGAKSSKKTTRGGARGEGAGAAAVPPRESRDYGVGEREPRSWGRDPRSAATATDKTRP